MNIIIFHFPYFSVFGGLERQTLDLFAELKNRGHRITFCGQKNEVLFEEMKKLGIKTIPVKAPKMASTKGAVINTFLRAPQARRTFKKVLRELRDPAAQNVLFCISLNEKVLASDIAGELGYKTVWVEHVQIGRWLRQNPFLARYKKLSRQAQIVTPSPHNAAILRELQVENVNVIPNGIDTAFWAREVREMDPARVTVGIGARLNGAIVPPSLHATTAPLAGQFHDKGADIFIYALARLQKHHPHIRGVIAGDGPDRLHFEKLARELGAQVEFAGFLAGAQYRDFVHACDIFVVPSSNNDSFSIAAAESLAAGVPTAISDFAGITDFVKNGEAKIIAGRDPDAIIGAILELSADPAAAAQMAAAGQKLARQNFDLAKMVDGYERLFQK